jgi:hypothetical protein
MGTGSSFVLRETTISVSNIQECGANSDNMICAGQMYPQLHDSCQVYIIKRIYLNRKSLK